MLFNSLDFALFCLVVFPIQWALPHRPRNVFLLAASCVFYAYWDWRFLGLLWTTISIDYTVARLLDCWTAKRPRQILVGISVGYNLSVLAFFKYSNLFLDSAHTLAVRWGISAPEWHLSLILPLGISFYTFQSLSYVVDVYHRKLPALRSLVDYGLYVTLFPQLVAGPIERGTHLVPQILHKPAVTWKHISDGTWLFLKGLFKKAVLADNLAPIVDRIFSLTDPTGGEVLLGVYAFAFQIYGDFAGYTDMARGVAKWLGYDLMLNFRLPYFATNPSEFWQRWHLSLSTWLRDYLYIPLGGNRGGLLATCRNLMVTMVLGGLWHGANWTFVLWGAFHGVILVAFRLGTAWRESIQKDSTVKPRNYGWLWIFQVGLMFHLVCLGWLLFRASSVDQITGMLAALASPWTVTPALTQEVWQVGVLCLPLLAVQLLEERTGNLNAIAELSILPRSLVYAATLISIFTLGSFGGREFIYFQF